MKLRTVGISFLICSFVLLVSAPSYAQSLYAGTDTPDVEVLGTTLTPTDASTQAAPETLPFSGYDGLGIALWGMGFVALGFYLRRRGAHQKAHDPS